MVIGPKRVRPELEPPIRFVLRFSFGWGGQVVAEFFGGWPSSGQVVVVFRALAFPLSEFELCVSRFRVTA